MKKGTLFLLIVLLFSALVANAQYNKLTIEPEMGLVKVRDVTSVNLLDANIGVRYMANTLFGAKLDIGRTTIENNPISYKYSSLSGVVNVGRLLKFESFTDHYTILGGLGGTYTYSTKNDEIFHRLSNFHLSGFIDNEVKLSNDIFLRAGINVVTGVNSRPFTNVVSTETTSIVNFNLGVSLVLGNKKEHADWYIEKPKRDSLFLKPVIIDKTKTIRQVYVERDKTAEYVFFKHDSYVVDKDGLDAIKKISDKLTSNDRLIVNGYTSPPGSQQYNYKLANLRIMSVISKLESLGITTEQLEFNIIGEVDTEDGNNVDLSRRVTLRIQRNE